MMKTADTIKETREILKPYRKGKIALVPTMGYLHEGHMALVAKAREQADFVALSLFVNPLQFGPDEDLETYPRDLERDLKICEENGVDFVFHPSEEEMYPKTPELKLNLASMASILDGKIGRASCREGV